MGQASSEIITKAPNLIFEFLPNVGECAGSLIGDLPGKQVVTGEGAPGVGGEGGQGSGQPAKGGDGHPGTPCLIPSPCSPPCLPGPATPPFSNTVVPLRQAGGVLDTQRRGARRATAQAAADGGRPAASTRPTRRAPCPSHGVGAHCSAGQSATPLREKAPPPGIVTLCFD